MQMMHNAQVTPAYEDNMEMQLLMMLLLSMKIKHMDCTLMKIYLKIKNVVEQLMQHS